MDHICFFLQGVSEKFLRRIANKIVLTPQMDSFMQENSTKSLRMLRRTEVQDRLGIARSTLYSYLNKNSPGYMPSFPKPVYLGATVLFLEHEVDEFVASLVRARDGEV